jgi:hypothetical protein
MVSVVHAEPGNLLPVYGAKPGYLFDVADEKNKRDLEMVMLEPPPKEKPLGDVIFDQRLSKEFQTQYEYRFGRTAAIQVINSPGRFDEYTYFTGENIGIEEYRKYQRQFAEYMGRRLTEHHVDQWAKKDPDFRAVYEFKDKISNLNVEVKKGYKMRWRYAFSGNYMDFRLENPYDIDTKVTLQMNPAGFGPSKPEETQFELGYQLTKRVRTSALYRQIDGFYQLVFTRQLTRSISTSLTASTDQSTAGPSVHQNLILLGLGWQD